MKEKESIRHRDTLETRRAFDFYYTLGEKRTLKQVAAEFGTSERTAENWSRWFDWQDRVEMRDIEIASRVEEKTNDIIVNIKAGYRKQIEKNLTVAKFITGNIHSKLQRYINAMKKYEKLSDKEKEDTPLPDPPDIVDVNTTDGLMKLISVYEKLIKLDLLMLNLPTDNLSISGNGSVDRFLKKFNEKA